MSLQISTCVAAENNEVLFRMFVKEKEWKKSYCCLQEN